MNFSPPTAILGTGWLGLPVSGRLARNGEVTVTTSYRRPEVAARLTALGCTPVMVDLPDPSGLSALLDGAQRIVFTLPPGGRRLGEAAEARYLSYFEAIRPWLADRFLLFTSSTGVYGSSLTASARAVVAAERWIADHCPHYAILRLAGLIGPYRHPGNFYGGKERPVARGLAPVNLVHRDDVISAIELVLAEGHEGTYNVCAAAHPTKYAYYSAAARSLGKSVAGYEAVGTGDKTVDSGKLRALGWAPKFDDLII